MNDFSQRKTHDLSSDDTNRLTEITSNFLLPGESILEIRAIGIDKAQIDVGIVINLRSGTGRWIALERSTGDWTVTDVKGWIA